MGMAAAIWLVSGIQPVSAQPVVTSAAPSSVAVTIYRDPDRPARQAMDRDWLNGFALVSESRTIAVPPGGGEIRFEGVAGGILPQSAIVTGLPDGVVEKNQDAMLLSPGNLVARSLGERVHLRRTSRATGDVIEQEAVVRSGPDGAVVLQTAAGFESLRCTGLAETIVYDKLPDDLSAKPTLSVRTAGGAGGPATVTLSYLATGFDWQGNYVAELAPSGDHVDLFAWVTLASADETSFADAETQTVAGRLNRAQMANVIRPQAPPLHLQCWPEGTTSDGLGVDVIVVTGSRVGGAPPPAPPPPPAAPMMMRMAEAVMVAQQEELGDLKLYRIPERVTVAAKSQKQVAMLVKPGVRVRQLQRSRFAASGEGDVAVTRVLATRNRSAEGLGVPLPAGGVALFGTSEGRRILLGEGFVEDRAVGEDVEIAIGAATQMIARIAAPAKDRRVLTVTNATAAPVRYEAEIDGEISGARLARRNGRGLWSVTIPANGSASLSYRVPGTS
ncbi:DUF4139 domain-containing protein [Allosphingosinicella indica]|nr:hypothetical protein [Allosphingosinicella indica]